MLCVNEELINCLSQRATVTLMWPHKIEAVGFGPKKVLAERYAAAAACQKLKASTALDTKIACPGKLWKG